MDVIEFVDSIYLGDRACKKIVVDCCTDEVRMQVDIISRVRSADGRWNYYTDEDIEDGYIVFTNVKNITWSSNGKIPNDQINFLNARKGDDGLFVFTLSADSVAPDGTNCEVVLQIAGEGICLMDPANPGVRITD